MSMDPPALLRCLRSSRFFQDDGLEQVRACLAAEPEAASQFFFDCDFEPVLCCAVRLGCGPKIVRELLRHGADAAACEISGYTPLTLLASLPSAKKKESSTVADTLSWFTFPHSLLIDEHAAYSARSRALVRDRVEVARLLIEGGVNPKALDGGRRSPVAIAEEAGNMELARFIEYYREVQAGIVLLRAQPFAGDVLQVVLAHLLPSKLVEQLGTHVC